MSLRHRGDEGNLRLPGLKSPGGDLHQARHPQGWRASFFEGCTCGRHRRASPAADHRRSGEATRCIIRTGHSSHARPRSSRRAGRRRPAPPRSPGASAPLHRPTRPDCLREVLHARHEARHIRVIFEKHVIKTLGTGRLGRRQRLIRFLRSLASIAINGAESGAWRAPPESGFDVSQTCASCRRHCGRHCRRRCRLGRRPRLAR